MQKLTSRRVNVRSHRDVLSKHFYRIMSAVETVIDLVLLSSTRVTVPITNRDGNYFQLMKNCLIVAEDFTSFLTNNNAWVQRRTSFFEVLIVWKKHTTVYYSA